MPPKVSPFISSKEHPAGPDETDVFFWPEYMREETEFFENAPSVFEDDPDNEDYKSKR